MAGWAVAGLFAVGWLPAAIGVFGAGVSVVALPGNLEGWAYLAVAGLPLSAARLTLGSTRPVAAWAVFLVLAPLATVWCIGTAEIWSAMQAARQPAYRLGWWSLRCAAVVPRLCGWRTRLCAGY